MSVQIMHGDRILAAVTRADSNQINQTEKVQCSATRFNLSPIITPIIAA